jgi:GntR family transcriptional regulator
LAADLRRRLSGGQFAERFPTEAELVRTYSVSRATVRQALARLRDDGLVESRQGAGTFVADPARMGETWGVASLALSLTALGVVESSVVRHRGIEEAADHADRLGLAPGDPVVRIERVRMGDGEPLAVDRSWLPGNLAAPLLDADLTSGSLYAALAATCGVRVTGGTEELRPAPATADDRRLLHLPRGEAVFVLDRVALAGTRPVEVRTTVMRGDRYGLVASWGRAAG